MAHQSIPCNFDQKSLVLYSVVYHVRTAAMGTSRTDSSMSFMYTCVVHTCAGVFPIGLSK